MLLVNAIFTDNPEQFKAPTGMMYKVESVHIINLTAEAGTLLYLQDFNIHPNNVTDNAGSQNNWLAIHECDSIHSSFTQDINEKTKFLIVQKNSATTINARITVYGKLVKASRLELLVEWFRKVR